MALSSPAGQEVVNYRSGVLNRTALHQAVAAVRSDRPDPDENNTIRVVKELVAARAAVNNRWI